MLPFILSKHLLYFIYFILFYFILLILFYVFYVMLFYFILFYCRLNLSFMHLKLKMHDFY